MNNNYQIGSIMILQKKLSYSLLTRRLKEHLNEAWQAIKVMLIRIKGIFTINENNIFIILYLYQLFQL